jgi:hypothetical protein
MMNSRELARAKKGQLLVKIVTLRAFGSRVYDSPAKEISVSV